MTSDSVLKASDRPYKWRRLRYFWRTFWWEFDRNPAQVLAAVAALVTAIMGVIAIGLAVLTYQSSVKPLFENWELERTNRRLIEQNASLAAQNTELAAMRFALDAQNEQLWNEVGSAKQELEAVTRQREHIGREVIPQYERFAMEVALLTAQAGVRGCASFALAYSEITAPVARGAVECARDTIKHATVVWERELPKEQIESIMRHLTHLPEAIHQEGATLLKDMKADPEIRKESRNRFMESLKNLTEVDPRRPSPS